MKSGGLFGLLYNIWAIGVQKGQSISFACSVYVTGHLRREDMRTSPWPEGMLAETDFTVLARCGRSIQQIENQLPTAQLMLLHDT